MTVAVRGRLPSEPGKAFQEIQERLIALERNAAGPTASFTSPSVPAFGGGTPSGGGGGGVPPATGTTDHGALTGLADDDHPQYLLWNEQADPQPHVHGEWDVRGLENHLVVRGESITPAPHIHGARDVVGIDAEFVRRGESVRAVAHQHMLGDVADFNLWEMMLWKRVLGG